MKTVFKVGMKVYDQLVFPDKEGKVISVVESDDFPIKVHYEGLEINELSYTADGRYYTDIKPTLATKPYTLQGFEQKALVPTFEDVWDNKKEVYTSPYYDENYSGYPSEELADAAEALRKLLFLRDYYNEGWMADWNNSKQTKYTIEVFPDEIWCDNYKTAKKILSFRNDKIRDKFLEEQKELLEIAKPLL